MRSTILVPLSLALAAAYVLSACADDRSPPSGVSPPAETPAPDDGHELRPGDKSFRILVRDDGTSVEVRAEHDDRSPIGPDEVLVAKVGSASITLGLTTNEIQAVGFFTSAANAVEPVIVELQRPNRPVSVFEVTLSPPFEAPSISSSAIKIGSPVAVHVRKPTLSADAPPCDDASVADCTALSVQTLYGDECAAGQVAILSLPSADPFPVDFIATPGETAPPCTDWLGLRARRTVTYEDGIVFGDRFRGALVDFTE